MSRIVRKYGEEERRGLRPKDTSMARGDSSGRPWRWRGRLTRLAMLSGAAGLFGLIPAAAGQTIMASWLNPVDGTWTDASKWSSDPNYPNNGTPAGSLYDVTIGAGGGSYTVTLNSDITTSSITLDTASAILQLDNGTLRDATITGIGQINLKSTSDGTLLNTTVGVPMNVLSANNKALYVGDSTLNSAVHLGTAANLVAIGSGSINGSAEIIFDGTSNPSTFYGASLSIGAGLTVHNGLGNGSVGRNGFSFTNFGTIAATAGRTVALNGNWINQNTMAEAGGFLNVGGNWTNQGTVSAFSVGGTGTNFGLIKASGNTLNLFGTWTNQGTISGIVVNPNGTWSNQATIAAGGLSANGTWTNLGTISSGSGNFLLDGTWTNQGMISGGGNNLYLDGNWANHGTLVSSIGGTLNLGGAFTSVGTLVRNGGTLVITGTFDNASQTTSFNLSDGSLILSGGRITGGRIESTGIGQLIVTNNGVVSIATLAASVLANGNPSFVNTTLDNGTIHFTGGSLVARVITGTGEIDCDSGYVTDFLTGSGIRTRVGTGGGTFFGSFDNGGTFTVSGGAYLSSGGTNANHGTIDLIAGQLIFSKNTPNTDNFGTITNGPGSTVVFDSPLTENDGTIVNNGGTLVFARPVVSQGRVINNDGTTSLNALFSGAGALEINGGTLLLSGTFTTGTLGSFGLGNASIVVTGFIDNTNQKLEVGSGNWRLSAGTIKGGTINATAGVPFMLSAGVLDGVTLNGSFIRDGSVQGDVYANNGLTLASASIDLQSGAFASPIHMGNIAGSGSIIFDGNGASMTIQSSVGLGSGITIATGTNSGVVGDGIGSISNSGTLLAQNVGKTLKAVGPLFNNGTLAAVNGGSLLIANLQGDAGTLIALTGGQIGLNGTYSISRNLDLIGSSMNLTGTWSNNAAVHVSEGGTLELGGSPVNMGSISVTDSTFRLGLAMPTSQVLSLIGKSTVSVVASGLLNNAGNTIDLNAFVPALQLNGGTIGGGTISGHAATLSVLAGGGTLTGIAVDTNISIGAATTLNLAGAWQNNGTITTNGGALHLFGSSSNIGTIHMANGSLGIDSTFTTAQISAIDRVNSPVFVGPTGTIDNTGLILDVGDGRGAWEDDAGTILGGTLVSSNGTGLKIGVVSGVVNPRTTSVLNGVIIRCAIDVPNSPPPTPLLSLAGSWRNEGTITLHGKAQNLGGSFTYDDIGVFNLNGGSLIIAGTLNNSNAVMDLTRWGGKLFLSTISGTIEGGTIQSDGPIGLTVIGSGTSLRGFRATTLAAPVSVSSSTQLCVYGGLTLDDATVSLTGSTSGASTLNFQGSQLVSGTGTIVLNGARDTLRPTGGTVTFGPGITIRTGLDLGNNFQGPETIGGSGANGGTYIVNQGTLLSQTAGQGMFVRSFFTNQGTVAVRNGGTIAASNLAAFTNFTPGTLSGGSWVVYSNSTLSTTFAGSTASITTNNANVILDGLGSSFITIDPLQTNLGQFTIRNRRNFNSAGSLTNSGTVTIGLGSAMKISGSLNNTGTVDLDGVLIVDYSAGNSQLATLAPQVASGFAGGAWNGPGINSSVSALIEQADDSVVRRNGIGIAEAGSIGIVGTGTFAGQAVDDTSTLLRYTIYGDADLDGIVNSSDFTRLAGNFGQSGKSWSDGDYNYDGTVNSLDFNALAGNFGQQMAFPSQPALGSVVPEPGASAMLLIAGCGLVSRRRSQKSAR